MVESPLSPQISIHDFFCSSKGASAAACGGRLYVCGGTFGAQMLNSVERFDPKAWWHGGVDWAWEGHEKGMRMEGRVVKRALDVGKCVEMQLMVVY